MSNEIEKIASESFQATFLKKILKLEKGKLEENHFVSSFLKTNDEGQNRVFA